MAGETGVASQEHYDLMALPGWDPLHAEVGELTK